MPVGPRLVIALTGAALIGVIAAVPGAPYRRVDALAAVARTDARSAALAPPERSIIGNGLVGYLRADPRTGTRQIWTADPDGTHRQRLLAGSGQLRWSPDGTRVAIVQDTGDSSTLLVAKADLTDQRRWGRWEAADWTPDGRALVALRSVAGASELYLRPLTTGRETRLTDLAARNCLVTTLDSGPRGLLYTVMCIGSGQVRHEVHSARLAGSRLSADTVLVSSTSAPADPQRFYLITQARWRANGRVLFTGCVAPSNCPVYARANVYESNGSTTTRLTALAPGKEGLGFFGLAPAPSGGAYAVGLEADLPTRVLIRPRGTIVDPLAVAALDWQPVAVQKHAVQGHASRQQRQVTEE